MITRTITRKNGQTFTIQLDDEDAELFDAHTWHISTSNTDRQKMSYYVERNGKQTNKVREPKVSLHRVIAGATNDQMVDHRDRNTLNNQRHNLRICTDEQNKQNVGGKSTKTAGYIGVHRASRNRYKAYVKANGRNHYVGCSANATELAVRRDMAAMRLHGEFAVLNFPEVVALAA